MIVTWTTLGLTTVEFSKTDDTYKLLKEYVGFTVAEAQYRVTESPYQDGTTLLDTNLTPRKISIPLMVTAPTIGDVQIAVAYLARLFNPKPGLGVLKFTYENGDSYYLNCVGMVVPSPTVRGQSYQLVTLNITAHDPFWYGDYQVASLGTASAATFPLVFPFTLPSNLARSTLINNGDSNAEVEVVITGDVTNPKITNSTTGEFFQFTLNMDTNDVMKITTGFGNKTVTWTDSSGGGGPINGFRYLNADSIFWQLQPGPNTIVFSSDAVNTNTTVSITWRDKYSGV